MTAHQTPKPLPGPGHVMTHAEWQRHLVMHYQLYAALASQEAKKQ